jgi:site-specific DNA-methyltransferase (cytosine-N4-specific)
MTIPFALQREKFLERTATTEHISWFTPYLEECKRVLKPSGSLVLEVENGYQEGRAIRSLYPLRLLTWACDVGGFSLAQPFYGINGSLSNRVLTHDQRGLTLGGNWHQRALAVVHPIWWLSLSPFAKANNQNVLRPYSKRTKQLLARNSKKTSKRPSGHTISDETFVRSFKSNRGSIPPNLLDLSTPETLPRFFIKFLTEKKDLVVCWSTNPQVARGVAEQLERYCLSFGLYATENPTGPETKKSSLE